MSLCSSYSKDITCGEINKMAPVRLFCPTLPCPLVPCFVNNDFAWLCNSWDHLQHRTCTSRGTHLVGHWLLCVVWLHGFTMKAPAAAASVPQLSGIMLVLCEVMLWLHYGYVMAAALARREAVLWPPCQPGGNKHVCSSYGSWCLLPTS